jgi:phosphoribosylformylglycinamidine cyclo-ligase
VPEDTKNKSVTYADAGVDLSSGERAKDRIKFLAQKTFNRNVLGGIGGFGALYRMDTQRWKQPVLVSSADGVGTKLKVAFALGLHHTVGSDLVNHCVNDIAVQGATPLFFLDYLATGKLDPEVTEDVVTGLAEACRANGCVLIGGETAQMPGFYADGEYDLAGFIVGAVDRDKMITGAGIKAGDVLIGLPSTGLHTNGYSLARKLLFEKAAYKPQQYVTAI